MADHATSADGHRRWVDQQDQPGVAGLQSEWHRHPSMEHAVLASAAASGQFLWIHHKAIDQRAQRQSSRHQRPGPYPATPPAPASRESPIPKDDGRSALLPPDSSQPMMTSALLVSRGGEGLVNSRGLCAVHALLRLHESGAVEKQSHRYLDFAIAHKPPLNRWFG